MTENETVQEAARLAALRAYGVLDSEAEPGFDAIVALAAKVCRAPVAAISLIDFDRQWFKARVGLDVQETPRNVSFCAHAIRQGEMMIVPDALADPRFCDNPLVRGEPHVRFYAGAVLVAPSGERLGALCIIDFAPRPDGLSADQSQMLATLGDQVMAQLELRRALAAERLTRVALEAREAFHSAILRSSSDYAMVTTDVAGVITAWNEGSRRIFGWDAAEVLGRPVEAVLGALSIGDDLEASGEQNAWRAQKDGTEIWTSRASMPLRTASDHALGWLHVLRDRSAELQSEQALRSTEEQLSLALSASEIVGAWNWDVAADRVVADARFAEMYGVDPDRAAEGVPLAVYTAAIHPYDRAWVAAAINEAVASHGQFSEEYRLVQADGSVRWVLAVGRGYGDAERTYFPGVLVDITERRTVLEDLRAADVGRELALEAAKLGRWDHNPSAGLRYFDERARAMLGLGLGEDVSTAQVSAAIHPEDRARVAELAAAAINPERTGVFEERFRVGQKVEERWISARGRSFFENGRCIRFVGVMQDVTEPLRAAEQQARLIELGDALRELRDVEAIAKVAASTLGQALKASSAAYALFGADDRFTGFSAAWSLSGTPGPTDTGFDHLEAMLDDLRGGETIAIDDIGEDPRTAPFASGLSDTGAASLACAPLREDGRLTGALLVYRDVAAVWSDRDIAFIRAVADRMGSAIDNARAAERQRLLLGELNHRVKNVLAIVQSIVSQTLRTAATPESARQIVTQRLIVLGQAQDILTRTNWTGAMLGEVAAGTVSALGVTPDRLSLSGPRVRLGPRCALSLALALHELGTNAVKYGALSQEGGSVELMWRVSSDGQLSISWSERGGPPVSVPLRKGFGSRLIERAVAADFHGEVELNFQPSGVTWRLDAPLASVQER